MQPPSPKPAAPKRKPPVRGETEKSSSEEPPKAKAKVSMTAKAEVKEEFPMTNGPPVSLSPTERALHEEPQNIETHGQLLLIETRNEYGTDDKDRCSYCKY